MSVEIQKDGYVWACQSDFISIGFQPGEKAATIVRVVCTLITVSIVSSWCRRKIIGRYLLFFSHWLSGLLHQLAQLVLAQMVFLCWTNSSDLKFVKAMKFIELVSGNMLAVTNVAICVNLALVVSSHHTMSTVKAVTSPQIILGFLLLSVIATVAVVPFWETMTVSGTLLWSVNTDQGKHNWVLTSIFFMELLAGVAMATIGAMLAIFRWPELCQVWRLHRRIKFYIFLSLIAIVVDLAIGIGGLVYVLDERYKARLIVVTWTMRHVHIALDTLVLYSALSITNKVAVEVGRNFRPSGRGTLPKPADTAAFAHRRGLGLRAPSSVVPENVCPAV